MVFQTDPLRFRKYGDEHPSRTMPWRRPRGEAHKRAKMSQSDVVEARRRFASGESVYSMAPHYGVSATTLRAAVKGETWSHVK